MTTPVHQPLWSRWKKMLPLGGQALLLLLLILGGLFLRRPLLLRNPASLLAFLLITAIVCMAVPWLRGRICSGERWGITGLAAGALLLCFVVSGHEWHPQWEVAQVPGWVDALVLGGLLVVALRGFIFLCGHGVEHIAERRSTLVRGHEEAPSVRLAFWAPFLTTLVALTAFWLYAYFPYGTSPDSEYQWAMLHGEYTMNDIHTPAHTLFLAALLGIVDHLGFVIAVQILLVALLSGIFGRYLVGEKGVPLRWMVLLCVIFGLGSDIFAYMYPWKDTPYLFCVGIATYYCMRLADGDFAPGPWQGIALGFSLSLAALLRYNGMLLALACALVFLVWGIRAGRARFWLPMVLAAAVAICGVQLTAYRALGMERWENGFSLQVFASGIASVVAGEGDITAEELAQVDELMGLDWVRGQYTPWETRRLIWEQDDAGMEAFFADPAHSVYNNPMVVRLGGHGAGVVSLYLRLLPRNLSLMAKDIVYNTRMFWALEGPYSHVLLTALLALAAWACLRGRTSRRYLLAFLPVACNALSILISTITNEARYLLPTYALFAPLLLYLLASGQIHKNAGIETTSC